MSCKTLNIVMLSARKIAPQLRRLRPILKSQKSPILIWNKSMQQKKRKKKLKAVWRMKR